MCINGMHPCWQHSTRQMQFKYASNGFSRGRTSSSGKPPISRTWKIVGIPGRRPVSPSLPPRTIIVSPILLPLFSSLFSLSCLVRLLGLALLSVISFLHHYNHPDNKEFLQCSILAVLGNVGMNKTLFHCQRRQKA